MHGDVETIARPDETQIPIGHIKGIITSLGFDPAEVASVIITPKEVIVSRVIKTVGQPPVLEERRIPVIR